MRQFGFLCHRRFDPGRLRQQLVCLDQSGARCRIDKWGQHKSNAGDDGRAQFTDTARCRLFPGLLTSHLL